MIALLLPTVFATQFLFARQQKTPDYLFQYIKVWGFLKYYHPNVARGDFDVDSLFLHYLQPVMQAKHQKAFDQEMTGMIQTLGPIPPCSTCKPPSDDLFSKNLDNDWLKQLNEPLRSALLNVEQNRFQGKKHRYMYNAFEGNLNEPFYEHLAYPNPHYQLLALARFWNMIQYVFPAKYLNDQPWDEVLRQHIPAFRDALTQEAYETALVKLVGTVDDSHASGFPIKKEKAVYGEFFPGFAFRFVRDSILVTGMIDDSLCTTDDIRKGDVITGLNGKTIAAASKPAAAMLAGSNLPRKYLLFSNPSYAFPFRGHDSVLRVTVLRNGKIIDKQLHLLRVNEVLSKKTNPFLQAYRKEVFGMRSDYVFKTVGKDVGMVAALSLSALNQQDTAKKKMDSVMHLIRQHPRGLIIDLREYCFQNMIYSWLLPTLGVKPAWFADYFYPNIHYPGTLINSDMKSKVGFYPETGKRNPEVYPGRIILLVNENTLSQSEWVTMILQAATKVTVVGSQTAGADGDIAQYQLPGNYRGIITGRRVAYPDGTEAQRKGVKIDVVQYPTTEGVAAGRDELLERALQLISL